MAGGTGNDLERPTRLDKARWILVGVVTICALAIISSTYFGDGICRGEAGQDAAIKVCGPFGVADALWLGMVVLVIFLLLLPDVSEVSIAGIGSLKRIVEEQQRKAEEQEKRTAELERFVVTQMVALSVNNTLTQNTTFVVTPEGIRKARDMAAETEEGRRAERGAEFGAPAITPDRAVVQARVLELWEEIARLIAIATGGGRRYGSMPDPEGRVLIDHPQLLAWYRDYKVPFNTFRGVRNAVAHPPNDLSDEDLRNALDLGESLLKSIEETLGGEGQPESRR